MFNAKKLYYTYINPTVINHYRLLIVTEKYQNINREYFDKLPTATGWSNLDEKLHQTFPESKTDCDNTIKMHNECKTEFLTKIKLICKDDESCKKYGICSDWFNDFYVKKHYHYEQNLDDIMNRLKTDIVKNNL